MTASNFVLTTDARILDAVENESFDIDFTNSLIFLVS